MGEFRLVQYRGRFAAVRYDESGKRHRNSLGTADRAEAERLIEELNRRDRIPQIARTVSALWKAYLEEMAGRAIVETMRHTAKAILPRFGHLDPESITVQDCRAHVHARRSRGIKDGTIHTELGHLRMVLSWAEKRRLISHAPHVERPPKPEPVDRHLTKDEVQRLCDAATKPHVKLAIILMIGTGARIEALSQLTWDRVDFESGLIHLRDRSDTMRRKGRATVPMNGSVRAALSEARGGALTAHVIEWGGKPVRSLKRALRTAAAKAGIERVGHHLFRHTAAVWMVEAGVAMEEIAQFLGHSNVNTTRKIYARFSHDYLREAAKVLTLDRWRA